MGIKKFRPTTPSRRFITTSDFSEVTASRPEKLLAKVEKADVTTTVILRTSSWWWSQTPLSCN